MSGEAHQEAHGYTVDELMISVLASFFEDGDQACKRNGVVPTGVRVHAGPTHARSRPRVAGGGHRSRTATGEGAGFDSRIGTLERFGHVHGAIR